MSFVERLNIYELVGRNIHGRCRSKQIKIQTFISHTISFVQIRRKKIPQCPKRQEILLNYKAIGMLIEALHFQAFLLFMQHDTRLFSEWKWHWSSCDAAFDKNFTWSLKLKRMPIVELDTLGVAFGWAAVFVTLNLRRNLALSIAEIELYFSWKIMPKFDISKGWLQISQYLHFENKFLSTCHVIIMSKKENWSNIWICISSTSE